MSQAQAERSLRSLTFMDSPGRSQWSPGWLARPWILSALGACAAAALASGCESSERERDAAWILDAAPPDDPGEQPLKRDASQTEQDAAATAQEAGRLTSVAEGGLRDAAAPEDAANMLAEAGASLDAAPSDASASDAGRSDAGPSSDASLGDGAAEAGASLKPAPLLDQTQPTMVNGISIDELGYLWVAAGAQSQLLRLEPPGEKIIERHGTQWELDGPDDLVATPEAVYYSASLSGNVNRLDRRTGKSSVLGSVGIGVNAVVLTSAGVLLAGIAPGPVPALAPFFTGLFEVDKSGVQRPRSVLRDSRSINAFCVAPDGHAYGPTQTAVLRIDLATSSFTTLHEGFGYAGAVRYNPRDALLYVLDVAPKESPRAAILYRMGLDGSGFGVFARLSAVSGDSFSADNFAIAQDGTLYVTRLYEPKITRVSADGTRVEDFVIGKP